MSLTDLQIDRYARHVILKEVGGAGQKALLAARVLVVGAGGLGSPLILYLAAAGVGVIGIVDDDDVSLSNLQRQVLHSEARLGVAKTESAREAIAALNPDVQIEAYRMRLDGTNVDRLVAAYDIIADGSDNFETRFLLHDACYRAGKTLVSAAMLQFDGQISTFKAHLGAPHPCYRCLYPEPPPREAMPSCAEAGVIGALGGIMGSLQALEVIKEILGIGVSLSGRLILIDGLGARMREVRLQRDPACKLCGTE